MKTIHQTVLKNEAIDLLNLSSEDVVIDGTLGGGGHTEYICKNYPASRVFAFDLDDDAIERSKERLSVLPCDVTYVNDNFLNFDIALKENKVDHIDAFLLDLGFSSDQLEASDRGFSFQKDEPLLMTLKFPVGENDITAYHVVNMWGEETLISILRGFGEERYAKRIAGAIVEARKTNPITTTKQLSEIIMSAVPVSYQNRKTHPATKTFQAIRIAVNSELDVLREVLEKAFNLLSIGGRISVISFHSLEDRIVKRFIAHKVAIGAAEKITKKPLTANSVEIKNNPRARSAKLRVVEKLYDI